MMKNQSTPLRLINPLQKPAGKILFLGYSESQTTLINKVIKSNFEVWHTSEKIKSTIGFDIVVSYGYRHILTGSIINNSKTPIVNLHISYLPWNRGAHPNFWSFYESTPCGVTIHLIDEGIDTGAIIYQKEIVFDAKINTFSETYLQLKREIEKLFLANINSIINKTFPLKIQSGGGSYHSASDLPENFQGWGSNIKDEISRLKNQLPKKQGA
jgi:methionyl-tRNA formyltransferase